MCNDEPFALWNNLITYYWAILLFYVTVTYSLQMHILFFLGLFSHEKLKYFHNLLGGQLLSLFCTKHLFNKKLFQICTIIWNKFEKDWLHFIPKILIYPHCKCLQGITGTLQGNRSAGISNLWGLHVYLQSL